jgi:PKD repeat protein
MKKSIILLIVLTVGTVSCFSGCNEQTAIEQENKIPTASCSANPTEGMMPLTVNFVGSGSDSDGIITSYHWDFGDGESSTQQNPTHTYQSSGTYTVTFTVEDDKGGGKTATIEITVTEAPLNQNPTCSLNVNSNSGNAPFTVTFLLNADDEDGSVSFWELDIDNDGTAEYSDSGVPPSGQQHTFEDSGTYVAKLTVTDNEGASDYDTVTITVNTPPPEPITLSGSGDDVTSSFYLNEGIATFYMTHSGGSNFIIWLYNADTSEKEELLVNEIGSYSGTVIVGITTGWSDVSPGRYLFDVTAGGSWQVTIEQPNPSTAPSLPQTFTGSGADVPSPFMLESGMGAVKFKMHHEGSSNFIIWLYHVNGDKEELLVNEIGYYDGSTLVSVGGWTGSSPGIHYIDVEADGNWRIEISYV